MSEEEIRICPYCGSTRIVKDFERGIIYCADCGAIIEELDSFEFKPTNLMEVTQHRKLTPKEKTSDIKDRRLIAEFENEIRAFIQRLGLSPRLMKLAVEYFLELLKIKRKIPRTSIKYYASAILYVTARENNEPISLKKVLRTLNLDHYQFSKTLKIISKILKIQPKPIDPYTFLQQVLRDLRVSDSDMLQECKMLLEEGKKHGLLSGRDIRGVIGGIIYVVAKALGRHITQKDLAKICGVTEVTIRNRFLEFAKLYEELTGRKVETRKKSKRRLKVQV